MSQTKHTPGPWRIGGNKILGDVTTQIADLGQSKEHMEVDERIANAQLIAASPDLLVSLKETAITLHEIAKEFKLENGGRFVGGVLDRALNTIAKAEGR